MKDQLIRVGFIFSFLILSIIGITFNNIIIILLGLMCIVGLIYYNHLSNKETINKIKTDFNKCLKENNIPLNDSYLGDDGVSGISVLESQNKIAIIKRNNLNESFTPIFIDFNKIIESSIKEDGETVTKTNRGSQVAGTLVGGALAGGVGAVVGGLGAKQTSIESVRKITLEIVIDDLRSPIHEIVFFISPTPLSKNESIYKQIYSNANKWHKMMSIILKRNQISNI